MGGGGAGRAPKSVAHAELAVGGATWRKRPIGVNATSRSVSGSMCVRTSLVIGSNQWVMSVPAASISGCTSEPGFASTSSVRSSTRWKSDTQRSSARSWRATSAGVK